MVRVAYYLFLKPLSYLPIRVLYLLSNLLYFIMTRVIKYRLDVVAKNVGNSFPDLDETEQKAIIRKFYRHFADLIVESIKLFSISKKQVIERCKIKNPELIEPFFNEDRHIILVGGHYNNWEMLAVAMNSQIKHTIVGIYAPLSNKFFNKVFAESRTKYGTELVSKRHVKEYFEQLGDSLKAIVFGSDQSPQHLRDNTYWTNFLHQDTAVMFGTEKYATENNLPVVYFSINKVRRGYYETEFSIITDDPSATAYTEITEKHTRMLEEQIQEHPEYYLWTHKRWKHKRQTA